MAESATKRTRETAVLRAAEKSSVAFWFFKIRTGKLWFGFILLFLSFLRFLRTLRRTEQPTVIRGFDLSGLWFCIPADFLRKTVVQGFKATRVEPWSFLNLFLRASSRFLRDKALLFF